MHLSHNYDIYAAMSGLKEQVDSLLAAGVSQTTRDRADRVKDLFTRARATEILGEAQEIWGGQLKKFKIGPALVHEFDSPIEVDRFSSDPEVGEYRARGWYLAPQIELLVVPSYVHRAYERHQGYDCLGVERLSLDEYSYRHYDFRSFCRNDFYNLKAEGQSKSHCFYPGQDAADQLQLLVARIIVSDIANDHTPARREERAKQVIKAYQDQGKLYDSEKACEQAALEEAKRAKVLGSRLGRLRARAARAINPY